MQRHLTGHLACQLTSRRRARVSAQRWDKKIIVSGCVIVRVVMSGSG
jgi:hypothetical protein